MKVTSKVSKFKNKYIAILPEKALKQLNIKAGDMVEVNFYNPKEKHSQA